MKTRKNIFNILLAGFVAMACWSCDDEVEYTPAQESAVAETQVYFLNNESSEMVLGKDATSFTITVGRASSTSAQNVPLIVSNPHTDVFTSVPTSVDFAAGETEKEITIQVSSDMEFFKSYPLAIEIPEEFVNPYVEQENHPVLALNVSKEDYKPYAVGTYTSWWYEESWEHVLEYSELLGRYRLADLFAEGVDVEFTWDGGAKFTCLVAKLPTGIVHPSYGMVTAECQATAYREAEQTFLFQYKWTVSAGSFGSGVDSFEVTEWK